MIKKIKVLITTLILCTLFIQVSAFAYNYTLRSYVSWAYSDYSKGSYVPKSGSQKYYTFYDSSTGNYGLDFDVVFTLDSTNVINILDYNNGGDNPGTAADNKNCYLTLDQTAKPDNSVDLEIGGYQVLSNLPDPKIDLEINGMGIDVDETEVTALGTVLTNTSYYMYSYFWDYRDGDSNDSGKVQAQFAMSSKGFSDYNNVVQSSVIQATTTYGDNLGQQ